jgi:hypothetical protein
MGVELFIHDGTPWYLSPDVWVVPGSDPFASPGQPIAGQRAFLWARVRNDGSTPVTNASVRLSWAIPTSSIRRQDAHQIGVSAVALEPEETKEVLCLTPWIAPDVNNGHVCLLVEAFAPADSLDERLPLDPIGDRRVAQRNITVLRVAPHIQRFHQSFLAGAGRGAPTTVVVRRRSPEELTPELLRGLGLGPGPPPQADVGVRVGVGPHRPGEPVEPTGEERFELDGDGVPRPLALVAELDRPLDEGSAVLLVAEEVEGPDEQVVGGVALLALGTAER